MRILSSLLLPLLAANSFASDLSTLKKGSLNIEGGTIKRNLDSNWVQVHQEIYGESAGDLFGSSVSISSDGLRVAIGAGSSSGLVKVFQDVGSAWDQVHQDIFSEAANDNFGKVVSMSNNGMRLAIAVFNHRNGDDKVGQVRVYEDEGSSWVQLANINGEAPHENFSHSISMSGDGTRVAIGAPLADSENGNDTGYVKVFQDNGSSWDQLYQIIYGEGTGDTFGQSVSMSSNGSRLAVGVLNGYDFGYVQVFQDDGSSWVQRHQKMVAPIRSDSTGRHVSISGDGFRVAYVALAQQKAYIRVYEDGGSSWDRVHQDFGFIRDPWIGSVSMSFDGSRVAVGSQNSADPIDFKGETRIYTDTGSSWDEDNYEHIVGEGLMDGSGASVSLSGNGSRVAIGAYLADRDGDVSQYSTQFHGNARVFEDPRHQPTPLPSPTPTKLPTHLPTPVPSPSPTKSPTLSPTKLPTQSPTPVPSPLPTKSPTLSPTKLPTQSPTPVPSQSPHLTPTNCLLPTNQSIANETEWNYLRYKICSYYEKYSSNVIQITTLYGDGTDIGKVEVFKEDCETLAPTVFTLVSNETFDSELEGNELVDDKRGTIHYLTINTSNIVSGGVLVDSSTQTEGQVALCLKTTGYEDEWDPPLAITVTRNRIYLPYTSTETEFELSPIILDEISSGEHTIREILDQNFTSAKAIRCSSDNTEEYIAQRSDNEQGEIVYLCLIPPNGAKLIDVNMNVTFGGLTLQLVDSSEPLSIVSMENEFSNGIIRYGFTLIGAFFLDDNSELLIQGDAEMSFISGRGALKMGNRASYQLFIDLNAPVGCFEKILDNFLRLLS